MVRFLAVATLLLGLGWPAFAPADYAKGVRFYGAGRYDLAAPQFLESARAGDAESAYMLGRLYAMGDGVPQDWGEAWYWLDRAATGGEKEAAEARDQLQAIMTREQLGRAQALAAPPAPQPAPSVAEAEPGRTTVVIPRAGEQARQVAVVPPAQPPALTAAGRAVTGGPDQVREVQRRLNVAGYYRGPVDGRLGPATRRAIIAYQRDAKLPPTGALTGDLVATLSGAPPFEAQDIQQAELR